MGSKGERMIEQQWKFLLDIKELLIEIEQRGFTATGGELWRTPEQQAIYFEKGLSKTKNSMHLKRLALDLNFFKDGKLVNDVKTLKPIGEYWEGLDPINRWGGSWGWDSGHFERHI